MNTLHEADLLPPALARQWPLIFQSHPGACPGGAGALGSTVERNMVQESEFGICLESKAPCQELNHVGGPAGAPADACLSLVQTSACDQTP